MKRAIFLAAAFAATAARAEKASFLPQRVNTADLPGRCAVGDAYVTPGDEGKDLFSRYFKGVGKDQGAIAAVLDRGDPNSTGAFSWFARETDYYSRRADLQRETEEALGRMSGEKLALARANYASMLLYLGDFQKTVDYFAKAPTRRPEDAENGRVEFAVAQSYFRLGLYKDSLPFAKRARRLLPKAELDTLWQLMLTEMALRGKGFYKNHSSDYTTSYIRKLFPNEDASRLPFEDVTAQLGDARWAGTGSAEWADLDGDGWDELLILRKWFPAKIFKNDRGRLTPIPDENLGMKMCTANVQTLADVLNRGLPDIRRSCCNISGDGPGFLLENEGNLKFKDVTARSGLGGTRKWMLDAWADVDLDGFVDYAAGDQNGTVRLYHNNGDGTFTDVTEKSGIHTPGSKADGDFGATSVSFGDYDDDGYPDLFAQGWGWKRLYHNNGDGTFTDVTEKAGIDSGKSAKGYNTFFFDYDNDGKLDLFVGQYVTTSDDKWGYGPMCTCSNLLKPDGYSEREWASAGTIYRNNGDGTFTDMRKTVRFIPLGAMGANHADWNNDGYQDVLMMTGGPFMQQAEPMMFYQNNGDGTFTNLTPFTEMGLWGKGHGSAFGDYDHDGQLDLFANLGGTTPGDVWSSLLLHNKGNSNHWIQVGLKPAPGTNGLAIGAKVRVYSGSMQQLQFVDSGGTFSSQNSFTLHFGLGKRDKIDRLVVEWPNKARRRTELRDLPVDRAIEISEATGEWKTLWTPAPRPTPPAKKKAAGR